MPGAFTHMIAAEEASRSLEEQGLTLPTIVLNRYPQWLQAGAVGPDYPYLHHILTSHDDSDDWADLLHKTNTGDPIRAGIVKLRSNYPANKNSVDFLRSTAWFYGYVSHVVLDASIHPVVRATVGEYEQNKTEHRACEMYMDAWLYMKIFEVELINTEWSDYLRALNDPVTGGIDGPVVDLWETMLADVYIQEFHTNPPEIHEWHKAYISMLDISDINVGFFRHVASRNGIIYVRSNDISDKDRRKYINAPKLPIPNRFDQKTMSFLKVFRLGVENIVHYWKKITDAIEGQGDPDLADLPNWNLDKGTLQSEEDGHATLWV